MKSLSPGFVTSSTSPRLRRRSRRRCRCAASRSKALERLGDGDAVIDFEVTGNRPDCMSVMGMAREVATAFGLQVRRPAVSTSLRRADGQGESGPRSASGVTQDCRTRRHRRRHRECRPVSALRRRRRRRDGRALARVDAGAAAGRRRPSDQQHRRRHQLRAARARSADARVRPREARRRRRFACGRRRPGETLQDARRPDARALARHAGHCRRRAARRRCRRHGRRATPRSTEATTDIVFESAYFNPLSVRRTSKKLGLKTEASMRFERGADPRLPVTAMERACALLETIGAGTARGTVVDRYPVRVEPTTLRLRRDEDHGPARRVDPRCRRQANPRKPRLRAARRRHERGWDVTVPTRRVDVTARSRSHRRSRAALRVRSTSVDVPGADSRAAADRSAHRAGPAPSRRHDSRRLLRGDDVRLRRVSRRRRRLRPRASSCRSRTRCPRTSPCCGRRRCRASSTPWRTTAAANSATCGCSRSARASHGARASAARSPAPGPAPRRGEHWSGGARDVDFFDIKGLVERIGEALRLEVDHRGASRELAGRRAIRGSHGRRHTHRRRSDSLRRPSPNRTGLPAHDPVYVAEIDLDAADAAAPAAEGRVEPLPRFPSVTRDISILRRRHACRRNRCAATVREAAPATLAADPRIRSLPGQGRARTERSACRCA